MVSYDMELKFCPMCKFHKLHKKFKKSPTTKDGYSIWCKKCMKEYKIIKICTKGKVPKYKYPRSIYNITSYTKIQRRISLQNKRARDIGENGVLTIESVEHSFQESNYKCLCCGATKDLCLDHVIPLVKGGSNTEDNIQILCRKCNSKKHDKIIDYRIMRDW